MGLRVLLVDDHEVVRLGLATLLEDVPGVAPVGEAGSGAEAMKAAIAVLEPALEATGGKSSGIGTAVAECRAGGLVALVEEAGAGVFLDPHTGEILAMASTPAFNPNVFADGLSHDDWESLTSDARRPLHDRVIASYYAPGSTFKVVMAVAGLSIATARFRRAMG